MRALKSMHSKPLGLALAAVLALGFAASATAQGRSMARVGDYPENAQRPSREVLLSIGEGQLVNLPSNVADVWVSNPEVADVYVTNARQINLFGKGFGEATVFATSSSGAVVYATNIRVIQNINSVDAALRLAMPDADLRVNSAGQLAVLTGTVASPEDAAEAEQLVRAMLNPGVNTSAPDAVLRVAVVSRLRTATPLQVNLQVRIAEVSRDFSKTVGFNILTRDNDIAGNGFLFNLFQGGRDPGEITTIPGAIPNPATGVPDALGTTYTFNAPGAGTTSLGAAGRLLGFDILGALDLAENDGLVNTLANPNLTALSGETASFLAGGEIPIPVSQGNNDISIEFKSYGVSLAFTPTVLADGRISMRVRPEVSQLTSAGSVNLNGFIVPALTTRRAETTVELGSGQSFMIGGLLSNTHNNSVEKAPFLGDLPVLGALFRSKRFRRTESELIIVITPYLVKPVSANRIAMPGDGYRAPNDGESILLGQTFKGTSGGQRPVPVAAPPRTVQPGPAGARPVRPGFSFK